MTSDAPHPLDHVMLAAPDLEAATADFERRTGVRPSAGGRHPGQGSRNVLAALGGESYLEIIGPDLVQDRVNNFGPPHSSGAVEVRAANKRHRIDPCPRRRARAVAAFFERRPWERAFPDEPRIAER